MKLTLTVLMVCFLTLTVGDASAAKVTAVPVSIFKKFDIDRKWYAPPKQEDDIDRFYDSLIRADLLVSVLRSWCTSGCFLAYRTQDERTGTDYYVIHPVLKHISILGLEQG